jgi:hypothetical protein
MTEEKLNSKQIATLSNRNEPDWGDYHIIVDLALEQPCRVCKKPTKVGMQLSEDYHYPEPYCEEHLTKEYRRYHPVRQPKKRTSSRGMTCNTLAKTARMLGLKGGQEDWLRLYRILYKGSTLQDELNDTDTANIKDLDTLDEAEEGKETS